MNETEQNVHTGAAREDVVAAFEAEHETDAMWAPPAPKKRGKLSKTARAVVIGCITFNVLMMAVIAAIVAVKLGRTTADEPTSEVSINEHEGEIYIEDDALGGMWLPEYTNIPKSTILTDKITDNGGFKAYTAGSTPAKTGIDVSEFQTVTDWNAVKAAGVDFVMVRVGWRGYEEGVLHEDEKFREHIEGALDAGLSVGAYFFSQAVTPGEARLEANFLLERIASYDVTYPVAFDWESVNEADARTFGIQNDQLTALAREFANVIRANGYTPMLYFYKHLGYLQYDLSRLSGYDFWLSEPNDLPTFYYRYTMWQYKTDGVVPGVDGAVDLNLCFEPYD